MDAFPQTWCATICERRPLIAPPDQYVYPQSPADDDGAREDAAVGALEVMIKPAAGASYLATFVRGFAEAALPHGIWPCPHADWICAAAGGYVYMADTRNPRIWGQIRYRPVVEVRPLPEQRLLLFVGFHAVLAWGERGPAWESDKLSDEGLRIEGISGRRLHGFGWDMRSDKEMAFTIDLDTGQRLAAAESGRHARLS